MSTKKEELKFKIGEIVKIDYTPELLRKADLNNRQSARNGRAAIILNFVEKEEIGDFNKIGELYRYEVLVGKERIEIDQACIRSI